MSYRIDSQGVVYTLDTLDQERIGVTATGRYGIVLDEDAYRDDGRYDREDIERDTDPVEPARQS